jgi:hypothetical protein
MPSPASARSHAGNSSSVLYCAAAARAPKQARLARDLTRPKACKTAYNFFASEAWSHAKVLAPGADTKELSRIVGEMWKVR